jgi:hypothetical protein
MRVVTVALLVGLVSGSARAQTTPPPAPPPAASRSPGQQQYERERKSPGLALTLEALCPLAGAGTIYTGTEGDKAAFLAVVSGLSAGAGVASVFWLIHLDREHPGGASRAVLDTEQGAAISILVTAGLVYLLTRASGLSLASQSTDAFNDDLQRRLAPP